MLADSSFATLPADKGTRFIRIVDLEYFVETSQYLYSTKEIRLVTCQFLGNSLSVHYFWKKCSLKSIGI